MESNGLPLRIHISKDTHRELETLGGYITEERGLVAMKGKGEVLTYWLMGTTDSAIKKKQVNIFFTLSTKDVYRKINFNLCLLM